MIETVKALFAYVIATIVIVGGLLFLYQALALDPQHKDQLIIGAVIALITQAAAFVFGAEIATRAARQSERANAAGAVQAAVATAAATPPPTAVGTP